MIQKVKRAVYPGSFDPVTNGHLDIIKRASTVFDELIVAVAVNSSKKSLFTGEERVDLIKNVVNGIENVKVEYFESLLTEYLKKNGISIVIRGLRAVTDFDYEFALAMMNRNLYSRVETIFMMTSDKYSFISSRLVKEVSQFGGEITDYVPDYVNKKLKEKFKK